jgi:hypothetical protein
MIECVVYFRRCRREILVPPSLEELPETHLKLSLGRVLAFIPPAWKTYDGSFTYKSL